MVYNREGVKASKGPPPESSGESETELSEDDDDDDDDTDGVRMMHSHAAKEVKKREFAYRFVSNLGYVFVADTEITKIRIRHTGLIFLEDLEVAIW
jgi:hypothetical protein